MKTFIIGITGGVGRQVATKLRARGDDVSGLIRRPEQRAELADFGAEARVGDLTTVSPAAGLANAAVDQADTRSTNLASLRD